MSSTNRMPSSAFRSDIKGDVSIMFGLMAIILMIAVGAAVDMGRWLNARSKMVTALNAAVLAGARTLQLDMQDEDGAIAAAQKYYDENIKDQLTTEDDTVFFEVINGEAIEAKGSAFIRTPLLGLAGVDRLPLMPTTGAALSIAAVSSGGLEIAMMLDVTGSMCDPCTKIDDLKAAAKDLIDIVILEDQGDLKPRVALVPFSESVNAAPLMPQVGQNMPVTNMFTMVDGSSEMWTLANDCVSERTGPKAFDDFKPVGQHLVGRVYSADGTCQPPSPIVPLSSDKDMLKAQIDAFTTNGWTAGHIGTAWTWYMLSPEWASVLPAASAPGDYGLLTETNSVGQPKLRKFAVLMTDGEYNRQFCDTGIVDNASGGGDSERGDCASPNGTASMQARTLCANMKAAGIEVFTVGFELPETGDSFDTMQMCATSEGHFYDAQNGDQLKMAFRDIALKISTIHLTK